MPPSRRLQAVPATAPRAVLYLRQSVSRDDSISLELQETACRDYCARRGYTVTEVIADPGISGRTWNRPGVQRTLDLIEQRTADVIVLWRWSRLSRSRKDWAVAVDRVDVAGGSIESATEPVDVSTAAGRLQRGMLAELAAWESEVKGEQWKETHERRRRNGLTHGGGYRPGYVYEGKAYRPDPDTGPLVAEAYDRYIGGAGLRPIAEWLTAVGVGSRSGATSWTVRGVSSLLDTGWAAGLLHVHDPACTCRDARSCTRRIYLPGAHEPIIGTKQWTAYRDERDRRSTTPRRLLTPTTTLAGLVRCGACGYGMRIKQGRGAGGYYCCEHTGCPRPTSVVQTRALAAARKWLADYAAPDVDQATALAAAEHTARTTAKAAVARLARAVNQLDTEMATLAREYARGVVPETAYTAATTELAAERATAVQALAEASARTTPRHASPQQVADLLRDWDIYDVADRNRMCRDLLRVVVTRGDWRSEVTALPAWEWQAPTPS